MSDSEIVADEATEFFAPTSTDMIDGLLARYQSEREKVEAIHEFMTGEGFYQAIGYYIEGNKSDMSGLRYAPATEKMFRLEGAMASLNAAHWNQALNMTDVLDFMPAKRREEWFEQIRKMQTPDFEEATVRATLSSLLAQRMDFLAEKVDGIFRALSRQHVTNRPEGFSKRMILEGVTDDWGGYGREKTGHVNDLRQIIAKFMGRDEPNWSATNRVVEIARGYHRGEWMDVDGGALRIRCYLNGNAHLEVHPDMAWRLNQVLAHLYPAAIPTELRTKPKRKAKTKNVPLMERPLPFAVLDLLHGMRQEPRKAINGKEPRTSNRNALRFDYGDHDKHALAEAEKVITAIGGVKNSTGAFTWFEFDYDASQAIKSIIVSGCVPDSKSHQYYPTPERLAVKAVELAEIGDSDYCLEPSAGTGNIARFMPSDRTQCIEASALHCKVLEAKDYAVLCGDFLALGTGLSNSFDRVIMNPPFDQGRWLAHVEAAASVTANSGRIVAILPEGAPKRLTLTGFDLKWHGPFSNEFSGTSISVVILVADKAGGK